jgi:sugar phosphate isomerase/epimerase
MNQNRRTFIKTTASASTALLLSSLDVLAEKQQPMNVSNKGFGLKILATNWGFNGTLDAFSTKAKKEGYDGIEMWWPMEKASQDELFSSLKKHQLEVGFLCGAPQSNFAAHFEHFKKMCEAAASNKEQIPLYINCHSGKDYFSFEENVRLIEYTNELSKRTGILICHETHRSRMLFAAPVARKFLETIPDLKITLDASHWCNVSETLLQDQPETMKLAIAKTEHIHARIGHAEGPQVNDPRAPEWEDAVQAHLTWWDEVVERKKKRGEQLTILTEFGPPDYMPTTPYTRQPLADQWAINVHMMHLLRKRYLTA